MIYLDNSATTFPKPQSVREAAAAALRYSANPGRSGHSLSLRASETVFGARKAAVSLFNARSESDVVFTANCTAAINTVLKGTLKSGDHIVVSSLEHNAVMRPLEGLKKHGVTWSEARVCPYDNDRTVDAFRRCIGSKTRMIFCTHASNVWGVKLPVERLSALAHEYGLLFGVDAAQSAGTVPVDVQDIGVDYLCAAGHKGLYGPMGTGILVINCETVPEPLIEGGTGSYSISLEQPAELPDRLESGTPNLSGIAGLHAGIEFVMRKRPEAISAHEFMLIKRLYRGLSSIGGIKLYLPEPDPVYTVPILSFNFEDTDSEAAAAALNRHGIAVRAGLHCSPLAHRMAGTLETGAVRISPSVFTTVGDIDRTLSVIRSLARSAHG